MGGVADVTQAEKALLLLGYSAHSGLPRIGEKAQVARWGLGNDQLPDTYQAALAEMEAQMLAETRTAAGESV